MARLSEGPLSLPTSDLGGCYCCAHPVRDKTKAKVLNKVLSENQI